MLRDTIVSLAVGEDICWLSMHGLVSCTHGTLAGSATQIGVGETYGAQVFASTLTVSASTGVYTAPFGGTLSAGPYTMCATNDSAGYTCYATDSSLVNNSFSSYSFAFESGRVALGAGAFVSIHDGTLSATGLPVCGNAPCTSFTDDTGILPLPMDIVKTGVSRVGVGNRRACVLYENGTTTCWGSSSIPSLAGVSDICVYDGGMCGLIGDSIECVGSTAFVDTYFAFPTPCDTTEILWDGICIACAPGSDIQQGTCTVCPSSQYRSHAMTSCTLCGVGSKTNGIVCTPCGPAYDANCVPCGAGSQSYNGGACSLCILGTVRDTQASCSTCPPGSLPSADAIACARCQLPYALLYPSGATAYAQGTCTLAPDGFYVYGASWTQCESGTIRTGVQPSCATCPPGTINNASYTFCEACPTSMVRNTGGSCYACPSSLVPNAAMSGCVKDHRLSGAPFRYAGFAVGGVGLLTTALFYTHAPTPVRLSVLTLSIFILVMCALVK